MRFIGLGILIAAGSLPSCLAHACSLPPIETAFDSVAPTASDIVVVQVESLQLESDPRPGGSSHSFRGKIRVLKSYRGAGQFKDMTYANNLCSGLRIDVGGIYLIATDSAAPTIELNSQAAPILHLSSFFTFDPDVTLRSDRTLQQLEAALRGDGTFQITTPDLRQGMSTFGPPPPVPPPEVWLDR